MCKVNWCNNKPVESGKGYCRMHYDQIRKYGTTTNFRPMGRRNEYINKGEYTELHILDSEGNTKAITMVDNDVVEELKKYSFRASDTYIKTVRHKKTIYLHQIVMGKEDGLEVDHINRNKLDNRKCNLRLVNHLINANNKERNENTNIGLVNRKLSKRWYARYRYNNVVYHVGYFDTKEEAQHNLNLHREMTIKG